jgi:K+-transporting ATPase KdpF subunit
MEPMNFQTVEYVLGAVLATAILAYLFYALIKPEKF